uniref:Uncharacterized protein n=1 Tax=Anguilla anguilla TaxID=7936 RepID=A0A0E9Q875_ANGAN
MRFSFFIIWFLSGNNMVNFKCFFVEYLFCIKLKIYPVTVLLH